MIGASPTQCRFAACICGMSQVTAATHWLVGPVWDNLRSPSAVKARTALTDLNGIMATLHESGQTLDEVIQARFSID